MQVTDLAERVVAYDLKSQTWKVAHDPQPTGDSSDGGSIWPPFGDLLAQCYDIPIGFANVAVGATSTSQWKTDGELFQRLIQAGTELKDFRAVLWQQGESDVIEKTTTATYVERLIGFRAHADRVWGSPRPWMLAKSTLHPTVYNDPVGEANIRQAIETLIASHGFMQGPDTDRLDGANRGPMQSRRHFTGLGQRNAAGLQPSPKNSMPPSRFTELKSQNSPICIFARQLGNHRPSIAKAPFCFKTNRGPITLGWRFLRRRFYKSAQRLGWNPFKKVPIGL